MQSAHNARFRCRLRIATIAMVLSMVAGAVLAWTASASPAALSLPWWTVDGGGGRATGGDLALLDTAGQPDASSPMTGGDLSLRGGFWRPGLAAPPMPSPTATAAPPTATPTATPGPVTDVEIFVPSVLK